MRYVARRSCVSYSACLAVILACGAGAGADEPLKFGVEYSKIDAEYNDALRNSKGDLAKYKQATAAREAAVAALVKRAEEAKSQEHAQLARAYNLLDRRADAAREARAALAEKKSFLGYTLLIGALTFDGKMDEAEKAVVEAKEALGTTESYVSLHQTMASAYRRQKRLEDAAVHSAEVLDGLWSSLVKTPDRASQTFQTYLTQLSETQLQPKTAAKILPVLERLEKRLTSEAEINEKLKPIVEKLKAAKDHVRTAAGNEAQANAGTGESSESEEQANACDEPAKSPAAAPKASPTATAKPSATGTRTTARAAPVTVTDEQLAEAEKKLKADPKDKEALTTVLRSKLGKLRAATTREEFDKIVGDLKEFVNKNLELMADSREFISAGSLTFGSQIGGLINLEKFDEAEKLIEAWKARLAALKAESDEAKTAVAGAVKSADGMVERLTGAKKRAALVGQPYFPIEEATWLNGSPLKPEELRGKVVLLDFWAVWCGPCIATFPHLKHWNEEYGGKGLVIIGVTNRYQFDWDAENKRIKHVAGLEKEKEDAATTKFVEHHGLKHRIAVMSERSIAGKYLVSGIPQAVLIDRQGLIRMIKVGSGETNAKALEAAIRQSLDLPVAKASE